MTTQGAESCGTDQLYNGVAGPKSSWSIQTETKSCLASKIANDLTVLMNDFTVIRSGSIIIAIASEKDPVDQYSQYSIISGSILACADNAEEEQGVSQGKCSDGHVMIGPV